MIYFIKQVSQWVNQRHNIDSPLFGQDVQSRFHMAALLFCVRVRVRMVIRHIGQSSYGVTAPVKSSCVCSVSYCVYCLPRFSLRCKRSWLQDPPTLRAPGTSALAWRPSWSCDLHPDSLHGSVWTSSTSISVGGSVFLDRPTPSANQPNKTRAVNNKNDGWKMTSETTMKNNFFLITNGACW